MTTRTVTPATLAYALVSERAQDLNRRMNAAASAFYALPEEARANSPESADYDVAAARAVAVRAAVRVCLRNLSLEA